MNAGADISVRRVPWRTGGRLRLRAVVGLAILELALLGCVASTVLKPPGPAISAEPLNPPFLLVERRAIDPGSFDPHEYALASGNVHCSLPSGESVSAAETGADAHDWDFTIASRTVRLKPESGIHGAGWGAYPGVACDTEIDRSYGSHPILGYVEAFGRDGEVLWQRELPDFVNPFEGLEGKNLTIDEYRKLPAGSSAGPIMTSGPYLAVQYRDAQMRFRQAIYHRSGTLIGVLGPWQSFLKSKAADGWTLYSGDAWLAPDHEIDVAVRAAPIDGFLKHFFAWLTPGSSASAYEFRVCTLLPADTIRPLLGSSYIEEDAESSRGVLVALGTDWFVNLSMRTDLVDTERDYVRGSEEWVRRFHRDLWDAGVDVTAASKWIERDLRSR